ncbi:SsrA-binding protein [Buchnera aphidicola str. Bp (Baizongia pistaciae)]|uniref:SsrA-binding protein n=1 Tax=Buchnera aphidicola subsp. Baizongia pistaciae (strain Bp) TaxID=224915 RepID=SSRP_BUCBP|nr:SsrA-binding protein SmpB [Buchnera aphidicola]Q89AM9.1 RecName: Full=SsrA-binding protein; AltName: Full=Small protein B [Buchnera aphidicola str. Bp (Baizongia pistaciae)]AAO26962.1 SsrA-binding protein [Buchnera aphidicola str. Bp (Baizongia pistaciae)]
MKRNSNRKPNEICINRKAKYSFSIKETFEAGIVLLGWEVKSVRCGKINISNSYISLKNGEMYLVNSQFDPISKSNLYITYECNRIKKILLRKREITYLYSKLYKSHLTIIVLSIFFKKQWCKVKIGIAKGKTIKDKREHKKLSEWKKTQNRFVKRIRH